jgi:hypothetical protein
MKKTYNQAKPHRSFRRLVSQWFSSLLKRQNWNHHAEIQKIIAMLQDIGDSIEIIAREIARQRKADE